jgi:hypothetical protein
MSRGVLTVMLACGLLTQSAPHAHTHPDGAPPDHDLRPHLHIGAGCHPDPAHRHGRHCDAHGAGLATGPSGPYSVEITDDSDDDDDDAIYLAPNSLSAVEGGAIGTMTHPLDGSDLGPPAGDAVQARPGIAQVPRPHPPLSTATPGCPRYVRHLALLL